MKSLQKRLLILNRRMNFFANLHLNYFLGQELIICVKVIFLSVIVTNLLKEINYHHYMINFLFKYKTWISTNIII